MLIDLRRDRISTLRTVGAPRDALVLRRAFERGLQSVDLHPRGLGMRAIVCVRRVRASVPRRLDADWGRELAGPVGAALGAAVRPFNNVVPTDAPAVVWADEAEMLACLARDWVRGATDSWWWLALFGRSLSESLVADALGTAPHAAPAALELLEEKRVLVDVLRALTPATCARVGEVVAATFGSAAWTPATLAGSQLLSRARPSVHDASRRWWARLATCHPDVTALAPPARALFGLALALRRAPTLARTAELLAVLCAAPSPIVQLDAATPDPSAEPNEQPRVATDPTAPANRHKRLALATASRAEAGSHGHEGEAQSDRAPTPTRSSQDEALQQPNDTPPADDPPRLNFNATPPSDASGIQHRTPSDDPVIQRRTTVVETEFAGLMYLVNLALNLELYPDFTRPASPGLPIPFAAFLQLVGDRVIGGGLRHDAIVAILDTLLPTDEESPVASEAWMLECLVLLEKRAALLLGELEGDALSFLCRRAGRVALTPIRLDVHFALATHPLAIRLGGLDRNPSWVPGLGRIVELHYD